MIRIALAQINPIVGDLNGNRQKVVEYLRKARNEGASIAAFPELSLTGYPPEDLLYKEHFVEDNLKILKGIVKEVKGLTAIIGFVDIGKDKKLYNASAIIRDKKVITIYHKHALPNYGVFDEKRYFSSGDGFKISSVDGVSIAVNICEDIWPEAGIYLKQAKKGAKVIFNISSSPYDVEKLEQREALLKKRAKQTKAYICYVNLVGGQDELVFDGSSLVVSPKGEILAMAKEFDEDLVVVDLPLGQQVLGGRTLPGPKIQPLSRLERIYKALVLGTRDYVRKNGFKKVLIGLSGGIDSSLVAAIAVEAVGKENVIGVTMPSRYTSEETNLDSKLLAQNLGIEILEFPIEKIFKSYLETLEPAFSGLMVDLAEQNIQARIRGNLLMALSNQFGWLVLTTGNKSELAVGYCTLYGDMSGGFAVIKDVPKTKVYELSVLINKQKGSVIPESVMQRAPTAELKANQKDQDSLPEYEVLDKILSEYVEQHKSIRSISHKFDAKLVKEVINMIDKNEYKRRQAPPGIKITQRAFGKDWRLPITNKYREF